MLVKTTAGTTRNFAGSEFMAKEKSPKTTTLRVEEDIPDIAEMFAKVFRKKTPKFVSDILREKFAELEVVANEQFKERMIEIKKSLHPSQGDPPKKNGRK